MYNNLGPLPVTLSASGAVAGVGGIGGVGPANELASTGGLLMTMMWLFLAAIAMVAVGLALLRTAPRREA